MQSKITQDQCYCSFGDGIVYEFVSTDVYTCVNPCFSCALWHPYTCPDTKFKCALIPCQQWRRKDRKGGFWQISKTVDYQRFAKILENGG